MYRVSGPTPAYSTGQLPGYRYWLPALLLMAWAFAAVAGERVRLSGQAEQGGMLIGHAPDALAVWQDGRPACLSHGVFLLGFGRDFPAATQLRVRFADGSELRRRIPVAARSYRMQRINGLSPDKVTPRSAVVLRRIREDVAAVKRARGLSDGRTDFLHGFIWPVRGPVTGVYGSQRILNGRPRQPHYGVDIARPVGTPVVAPADGLVTLAVHDMFYSGGTLIIDHGEQLSSAFLHLSRLLVKPGQRVRQGEVIAEVGATGRASGAHLDWRMNLRDQRIDPQRLVPPMNGAKAGDE